MNQLLALPREDYISLRVENQENIQQECWYGQLDFRDIIETESELFK